MKKESWSALLGFVIIGVSMYGLWVVIEFFISALVSSDPKISAAILGAMATIFVGIAAVVITQRQTSLRDREEAHRAKKIEIYAKFLKTIQSMMSGVNNNISTQAPTDKELVNYLADYKSDVILWGSPQVIRAQLEFQRVSRDGGNIFLAVDNLHKAIREDIGLSNKGLNKLELVKMYLADPDEVNDKGVIIKNT